MAEVVQPLHAPLVSTEQVAMTIRVCESVSAFAASEHALTAQLDPRNASTAPSRIASSLRTR
eukprot:3125047-Pleurochrysis_carterae.AAC.1